MHILFLSHYFPPEVNAPASRTYEHCRRWVAAGHRVTVITCAPNCPRGVVYEGYRNVWRQEEVIDGIRVIRVWTLLAANRGVYRRTLNYLSYLVTATWRALWMRRVDVLVATSPQFFCGWAGVLCRWLRRWPLVLEIRDLWPESIVSVGAMRRGLAVRVLQRLERRMYAAAKHIVTLGEGYREKLIERGVPSEKITLVPNGVDLKQFAPMDVPRSRPGHPFTCTYVGTVGMAHGLEVVLEAARRLKAQGRNDVRFRIVGDGARRAELQQRAESLGLDNVEFTGLVPKRAVPAEIAAADACLIHLRGTALFHSVMPSKTFEIMALNRPIILGVRGTAAELVREADAGLVMTPEDPGSLLQCIDRLRESPDVGTHGRGYVARHYDRDRLAAAMLQVLAQHAGRADKDDAQHAPEEPRRAA